MEDPLSKLNQEEKDELHLIPVWVSLLIAGADNNFSKKEIKRAVDLAEEKRSTGAFLGSYYKTVFDKFEVNLKGYIALMPKNLDQRTEFLVGKIAHVNDLFEKIDMNHSQQLYLSFRDFAYRIAHASGGFFGLLSISFAESKYIDLKMIQEPAGINT